MLAADKLLLQSNIRQNTIRLKEKELKLHQENFSTVGTMSAVLAGFGMVSLVELEIEDHLKNPTLEFLFYVFTTISLVSHIRCISSITCLNVWGCSLALRGPDGSMQRAVEGMYKERKHVFRQFATGLFTLLFSVIFGGWLKMKPEPAMATTGVVLYGMWNILSAGRRYFGGFRFNDSESVSFDDLLSWSTGPFEEGGGGVGGGGKGGLKGVGGGGDRDGGGSGGRGERHA